MAVVNAEMGFLNKMSEEIASPSGRVNVFDYSMEDELIRIGAGTVPVGDEVWLGTITLTAGTATISVASLARTGRTALNLTGKRVLGIMIKNLGVADLTFKGGATNPYPIFVGTTGHVVGPGSIFMQFDPTGFGTVGPNVNIDITGTGTDSFMIALIAGPL